MTKRHNYQGRERESILTPQRAAFPPGLSEATDQPGQKSPVFHYETDRYRLVTPGWPEDSEGLEPEDGITLD